MMLSVKRELLGWRIQDLESEEAGIKRQQMMGKMRLAEIKNIIKQAKKELKRLEALDV